MVWSGRLRTLRSMFFVWSSRLPLIRKHVPDRSPLLAQWAILFRRLSKLLRNGGTWRLKNKTIHGLTAVNRARTWSPNKDLLHPVYVLTRKGDPFHLQRPHGVMELSWGHRYWITAIALPKWINNYHCVGSLNLSVDPGDPSVGHFWPVWRRKGVGCVPQQSATSQPQGARSSWWFLCLLWA